MRKLKLIEILDITLHKEDYIDKAIVSFDTYNNLIVNLQMHRKRKLCKKFRELLNEGVLIPNSYLCTYHFRNNKPPARFYFYLEEDNS